MKTLSKHYIDGAFVDPTAGRSWISLDPPTAKSSAASRLGDEEDTRRAIAAAKRAFATFGRTSKKERSKYLRRLHEAASRAHRRSDQCHGRGVRGVVQFARLIVETAVKRLQGNREGAARGSAHSELGQNDRGPSSRSAWRVSLRRGMQTPCSIGLSSPRRWPPVVRLSSNRAS